MSNYSPLLKPPCSGWKQDFNAPNTPPNIAPSINLPFTYMDHNYLEVFRSSLLMRWLLFTCLLFTPIPIIAAATTIPYILSSKHYMLLAINAAVLLCAISQASSFFKLILQTPRDEPIRFNRARQKIYAYNFDFCWWNPFIPWPIKVVSYDWENVRAERWRKSATTLQGSHIVKVGITLSIVEPGTNNVIDRFPLCFTDDESIWAFICTYMQQGPDAVPTPPPGRDQNEVLEYEFIKRLGPKVKWPPDIDLESRTTP